MIPSSEDAILLVAMTANGLLAGVYLAFAVAVSPALRRLDARIHVQAFASINRVIINPVFLTLFFGAPVSAVAAAVTTWTSTTGYVAGIVAAACSLLAFVITVTVNVPLNRALEESDARDDARALAARARFADRWDRANAVRAAACLAAVLTLGWAAVAS
ncbi:anthrone oxygenase family protein [Clavibacter sp. Sh2141]|uniref:anthrone oxygenase family protein n=1 Tax=Clavibacter sp. Sh2141 TaxID=3395374 RepID=UPI0039BD75A8